MNRTEFEVCDARDRKRTVAKMRCLGYYSAICDCREDSCPGWQSVAVPLEADAHERSVILSQFKGLKPQRFGQEGD